MRINLIIAFLSILLVACSSQELPLTPEEAWINQIDSVIIPESYHANYQSSFSSSSGNRMTNYTYDVINETVVECEGEFTFSGRETYSRPCNLSETFMSMSDIKSNLTILEMGMYQKFDNMFCYYNMSNPERSPMILFACFNNDDNIVAYGGKGGYGGIRTLWYIDSYLPNQEWYSYE